MGGLPLEVLWLLNGLFESSEISAYLGQWLFGLLPVWPAGQRWRV